jgi:hypothetical protein
MGKHTHASGKECKKKRKQGTENTGEGNSNTREGNSNTRRTVHIPVVAPECRFKLLVVEAECIHEPDRIWPDAVQQDVDLYVCSVVLAF